MSGKIILIIDDDEDLLIGLTPRLKANGYAVIWATDVISAMAVAREEIPDLIILDIGLPGVDGFQILDRLRDLPDFSEIPVIMLSARDPAVNEQRALNGGAVAYIQKPPDNNEFLSAIRKALGETVTIATFLNR
jgi:DNA-binding response OmpR family regulator